LMISKELSPVARVVMKFSTYCFVIFVLMMNADLLADSQVDMGKDKIYSLYSRYQD
jgi:hypothetical protein